VAHGASGHGARPARQNAIAHSGQAVAKVAFRDPPFDDATRTYFEKLA
jgi:hypothetical protein